jgi:hypothetical protein
MLPRWSQAITIMAPSLPQIWCHDGSIHCCSQCVSLACRQRIGYCVPMS